MFRKHGLMCRRTHSAQKPLIAPQSARHWLVLLILLRMTLDVASNTGATITLVPLIPAVLLPEIILHQPCFSASLALNSTFVADSFPRFLWKTGKIKILKLSFVWEGVSIRPKIICQIVGMFK